MQWLTSKKGLIIANYVQTAWIRFLVDRGRVTRLQKFRRAKSRPRRTRKLRYHRGIETSPIIANRGPYFRRKLLACQIRVPAPVNGRAHDRREIHVTWKSDALVEKRGCIKAKRRPQDRGRSWDRDGPTIRTKDLDEGT